MVGGAVDKAFERAARYGDGWIRWRLAGPVPERSAKARAAWEAAGREGAPRLMALGYYVALGDRAEQAANEYLRDYYAFTGQYAGMIADSAAKDAGPSGGTSRGSRTRAATSWSCSRAIPTPARSTYSPTPSPDMSFSARLGAARGGSSGILG